MMFKDRCRAPSPAATASNPPAMREGEVGSVASMLATTRELRMGNGTSELDAGLETASTNQVS